MIPKIIHYCWVGGNPLTPLAQKCIASWKKHCPDFEIIRWDETNYDFSKNQYMAQTYEAKKWGFVPDYARLDIIYQYGGIYLDTDVEIVKPLDELLNNAAFCGVENFCQNGITIALGLGFGAEPGHPLIKEMMDDYENLRFYNQDGSLNLTASPVYQTAFLTKKGLLNVDKIQTVSGMTVYPKQYFNPTNLDTGRIQLTNKTVSIHHYAASWLDDKSKLRYAVHKFLNRTIGIERTEWIRRKLLKK